MNGINMNEYEAMQSDGNIVNIAKGATLTWMPTIAAIEKA